MRSIALRACLLTAANLLPAQTPSAVNPPAGNTSGGQVAPGAASAKVIIKKPEPVPRIPGTVIARPYGTFLGLEVVNGQFKLSFYDKKKKAMAPDVTRATARWPNPRAVTGPNRTVLNTSGNALVGSHPVLPPFTFHVHLVLLQGDGDDEKEVESYDPGLVH